MSTRWSKSRRTTGDKNGSESSKRCGWDRYNAFYFLILFFFTSAVVIYDASREDPRLTRFLKQTVVSFFSLLSCRFSRKLPVETKGSFNGIKPVKTSKQNLTITLTRHLLPRNTSIKSAVEFNCATTCRKRPPPVCDRSPNH